MNLQSIISITGKPGLYKVVTQTKNGLIVESLMDNKRIPVYSTEKVSALEDISIYTYEEDLPLVDVYARFYDKTEGKKAIDHKSKPEELRNYLKEIIPSFDEERVYNSDIKKMFQWFNLLIDADLLKPEEKKSEEKEKKQKKEIKKAVKKPVAKKTNTKVSGVKGGAKTSTPSKKGK